MSPLSILLVEDNPGDARLIQVELCSAGVGPVPDLFIAPTLAKALERLRLASADVCLLDLSLPDAEGVQGLQAISAIAPDLPVVVLTGLDSEHVATTLLREGAQDYLVKGEASGRVILKAAQHAIERKRLELALRESVLAAERANRAKSQFLANMSHELRTPLNAILGFAEIIEQGLFGPTLPKYAEYAHDIRMSGRHLLDLINDVLDMAKVEAGKWALQPEPLEVQSLAEECASLISLKAEGAGVALGLHLDPCCPSLVADRRAVKQVLLNLLSNAVKFTPAGGRVELTASPAEGGLSLSVADTGIGIPPDELPRLMRPFEQVEAAQNANRGTGLGLALSKALVELHGGSIRLDSTPGQGTRVQVTLPLRPAPLAA